MPTVSTLISSSGGYAPNLHYTGSLTVFTTQALVYDIYTQNTGPNRTLTYQNNVWSDSGTDYPILKDSNGNTITQTPSNPQSFVIDWYGQNSTVVNPYHTDQYGRPPSTAVSKSVYLERVNYRVSGPGDYVVIDSNPTNVVGGYQTLNVPSAIFCPRDRATYTEALSDRTLFENLKQPYTRNNITYKSYIFGGCIPNVLDAAYRYVELRAGVPFESQSKWYVNYTTFAYEIQTGLLVELITGSSHNPAHSVLVRYNITDNAWEGNLANISVTTRITSKTLKLQSVSPNSTQQWKGFSNLSNTTVDLLRFAVDIDTNIGSESTPPQSEVEVATTTSNGGGKPDRYPLIMTNLFNRNRSLYSIGMTHKDTWDLFL